MDKLLIAVYSDMFADALSAALRKDYIIRTCTDGQSALEIMNTFKPDAMILYLRLPIKDGFTILSQSAFIPKTIIAIADCNFPHIFRHAQLLGIGSVMIMPTINSLVIRLTQMRMEQTSGSKKDARLQVQLMLHNLGIDPKLDGWDMLLAGIPIFAEDTRQAMNKELYPKIAHIVGKSDGRAVEHAIRTCIAKAWSRCEPAIWAKYFPADKSGKIPCPSNARFIKALAAALISLSFLP